MGCRGCQLSFVPIVGQCRECQGELTYYPSVPRQFCSIACRTAHRRRAGAWVARTCDNCGPYLSRPRSAPPQPHRLSI